MSRLIDADALKEHKFLSPQFVQIGGRRNGKTLENINRAYQKGWNDAIDAIIDNAPTVELTEEQAIDKLHETGWMQNHDREMTEQPTGEWTEVFHHQGYNYHKCSNCCFSVKLADYDNFCPNCGADMRKGGSDDTKQTE